MTPSEHVHPLVRTQKQLDRVLTEIEEQPGIVLYTLLQENLVDRLEQKCRDLGVPCMSILGPVLHLPATPLSEARMITAQRVCRERRRAFLIGRFVASRRPPADRNASVAQARRAMSCLKTLIETR